MWSILIPAREEELVVGELWELGTAGWVEEAGGLRAYFEDSVARATVCGRLELAEEATRDEAPFDASQIEVSDCDPILIGERFYVAPSWFSGIAPEGRLRLTIDATSAFGSGRHESTQLCIEVLEKYLVAGGVVLDIGCGSGILSAAATLLGAREVAGCDIHLDSVKTARTFVETFVFAGSADAIRSGVADLVIANISAKVLDAIAGDLRRVAKAAGLIVVSGFVAGNTPRRFRPLEVWEKADWQCWVCRPQDIEAAEEQGEPAAHSEQWWL